MALVYNQTVLVALVKDPNQWNEINKSHSYRIPVQKAPLLVKNFQASKIAFYFPSSFENPDKKVVKYFADVVSTEQSVNAENGKEYYFLHFEKIQILETPIPNTGNGRFLFGLTTPYSLKNASEFHQLFER